MDINYLKKVLGLFDSSTARELEIEEENVKIKISRNGGESEMQVQQPYPYQFAMPQQQQAAPAPQNTSPTPDADPATADSDAGLHKVESPIVGSFYRAPAPDADPFVEVGSKVSVGTTLCIVEAMKLMNEIESDAAGTITEIMLKDADAVEFGQVLFKIKPD